jgi:hypothetical protein
LHYLVFMSDEFKHLLANISLKEMSNRSPDPPEQEPLSDAVAESLPEEITRRRAVATVAALTVGAAAISTNSDDKKTFDQAQAEFSDLAATIDESDLRDPRRATELKSAVSETLATVDSSLGPVAGLDRNRTTTAGTNRPNTPTWTSPQSPSVRDALSQAQVYYSNLESVLARAATVRESLRGIEPIVLYNTDGSLSSPLEDVPLGALHSAVDNRLSATEQSSGELRPEVADLYPDRQAVTTQLRDLTRVYDRLIAAQRATLDSGLTVVDATKHHERGEFETARSVFTTARKQADIQVPARFTQYDVSDGGLTLGQYDHLLSVRREGIESLREASTPELAESARRTVFDEGLKRILQARAILIENSMAPVF